MYQITEILIKTFDYYDKKDILHTTDSIINNTFCLLLYAA